MQCAHIARCAAIGNRQGPVTIADLGFLDIAHPDDFSLGVSCDSNLGQGNPVICGADARVCSRADLHNHRNKQQALRAAAYSKAAHIETARAGVVR